MTQVERMRLRELIADIMGDATAYLYSSGDFTIHSSRVPVTFTIPVTDEMLVDMAKRIENSLTYRVKQVRRQLLELDIGGDNYG